MSNLFNKFEVVGGYKKNVSSLKSLWFFAWFVLLFLILDIIAPFLYLYTLDALRLKNYYVVDYADFLVLGDSHASFGVDPDIFNTAGVSALSYAKAGHYSEFNYFLYNKISNKFKPPRAVIISIPYFFFSNESPKDSIFSLLDKNEFFRYYFNDLFTHPSNFFAYREMFQFFPSLLIKTVIHHPRKLIGYGYGVKTNPHFIDTDMVKDGIEFNGQIKIDYLKEGYSKKDRKNRRNYNYFIKLLDLLSRDKVQVFLVETPEYIDTAKNITGIKIFYEEMEEEVKKYNNVYFVKKGDSNSIDIHDKSLFFNGGGPNSHLSFKGSKLYTHELFSIIKEKFGKNL